MQGHIGESLVLLWPVGAVTDRGVPLTEAWTWLHAQGQKVLTEFLDNHCQYVALGPGSTVWVPYGWYCTVISYEDQLIDEGVDAVQHLYVPYWNMALLDIVSAAHTASVRNLILSAVHDATMAGEVGDWLGVVLDATAPEDTQGPVSGQSHIPIEDGMTGQTPPGSPLGDDG